MFELEAFGIFSDEYDRGLDVMDEIAIRLDDDLIERRLLPWRTSHSPRHMPVEISVKCTECHDRNDVRLLLDVEIGRSSARRAPSIRHPTEQTSTNRRRYGKNRVWTAQSRTGTAMLVSDSARSIRKNQSLLLESLQSLATPSTAAQKT